MYSSQRISQKHIDYKFIMNNNYSKYLIRQHAKIKIKYVLRKVYLYIVKNIATYKIVYSYCNKKNVLYK